MGVPFLQVKGPLHVFDSGGVEGTVVRPTVSLEKLDLLALPCVTRGPRTPRVPSLAPSEPESYRHSRRSPPFHISSYLVYFLSGDISRYLLSGSDEGTFQTLTVNDSPFHL